MRIAFMAVKGIHVGGGIEKLTEEIGTRLVKKGHEVVIYSSRDYGANDCIYGGMKIKTVASINTKSLHKLSICFCSTLDILRKRDVDIVHVHAVGPSIFSIFPRIVGIPTIVQAHGLEWQRDKWGWLGRSFLRLSEHTAVCFPNRLTVVSMVQKQYYENKYRISVDYIPTGVGAPSYRVPRMISEMGLEKDKYILFAARLVTEKGAHFLIQAFKGIDTDMKLVIAGDAAHADTYKSHLQQLAADDDRICFAGFVTGALKEELFSNAYVFCLPSTLEGLPISLLEAMSYGNCCIASDIPENMEAMENAGYSFRSRDAADLNRKLHWLIQNPDNVLSKRAISKRYVLSKYSWDTITDQMEKLYHSVLGG